MVNLNMVLATLAVLTSLACMVLLLQSYARSGVKLLLYSALCFVFLTINNVLLFFDLVVYPGGDLRPWRISAGLAGVLILLYGFARKAE